MHTYTSLRLEIDGHIARLTLNRPDSLNAIDEEMHADLLDALLRIRGLVDVRVVLFRGEGKAFSAGGDLNEVASLQADVAKRMRMCEIGQRIIQSLIDIHVPVVVALHGDAMGLGASVALGGDIIVASRSARIGDPHVKVGLVAGDGGVLFWPASMGMHRARRYLLTGDLLPAEEAWKFGLVTDLTETPEECIALAEKLATKVAGLPPIAVRGTKKSLNQLMKARANEAFDLSMAYEFHSGGSEDILEAVRAFKEKRKPVYHNR
jgi:enoyl-CoA hydratase